MSTLFLQPRVREGPVPLGWILRARQAQNKGGAMFAVALDHYRTAQAIHQRFYPPKSET